MEPKLVRDKIPGIIRRDGKRPRTRVADEKEYWSELKRKLLEEVTEFMKSEEAEELADINEVLHAIYRFKGVSAERITALREEKTAKRGGFDKRIILEDTD